jgi:hypothetical protein
MARLKRAWRARRLSASARLTRAELEFFCDFPAVLFGCRVPFTRETIFFFFNFR